MLHLVGLWTTSDLDRGADPPPPASFPPPRMPSSEHRLLASQDGTVLSGLDLDDGSSQPGI